MTEYMTVKEASIKWGISKRSVNKLCQEGKIPGVERLGSVYAVPVNAEKPNIDRRIKSGVYRDWRKKYGKGKNQDKQIFDN